MELSQIIEMEEDCFDHLTFREYIQKELEAATSGLMYGLSFKAPKKDKKWQRGRTRNSISYGLAMSGTRPLNREVELIPSVLYPIIKRSQTLARCFTPLHTLGTCDSLALEYFDAGKWCSDLGHSSFFLLPYCIAVMQGTVQIHVNRPGEPEVKTLQDGVFEGGQVLTLKEGSILCLGGNADKAPRAAVARGGGARVLAVLRWLAPAAAAALPPRRGPPRPSPGGGGGGGSGAGGAGEGGEGSKASTALAAPPGDEGAAAALEREHVRAVYDAIAPHWGRTRYRPWPRVAAWLRGQQPGLVLDAGCGNGKYLPPGTAAAAGAGCGEGGGEGGEGGAAAEGGGGMQRGGEGATKGQFIVGADLSLGLLRTAQAGGPGRELVGADCLRLPFRTHTFDAAISIAVMHHLSTEGRRLGLLGELRRVLRPGGRALVYAWALEQEEGGTGSRRFPSQDVFVPWHLTAADAKNKLLGDTAQQEQPFSSVANQADTTEPHQSKDNAEARQSDKKKKRPREEGHNKSAITAEEAKDNWSFVSKQEASGELLHPTHGQLVQEKNAVVYQRFCHVYQRGELESLVARVEGLKVEDSYYDCSNWCIVVVKTH